MEAHRRRSKLKWKLVLVMMIVEVDIEGRDEASSEVLVQKKIAQKRDLPLKIKEKQTKKR